MLTELFILVFIGAITAYFLSQRKPNSNYPPGPWGFPIFGHLPFLQKDLFGQMMRWKASYGPIIGLHFGSYRVVVINDYKWIREAMNDPGFSGRPRLRPVCERSGGEPKGIAFTDGHEWIEKRRFALKHLRDFGFGKKSIQTIVQDEIVELIEHFKADIGRPVSTINRFNAAILNALWTVISGQRFKQDDPELLSILKLVNSAFPEANSPATISTLIPILGKIGPNIFGFNGMMAQAAKIVNYVKKFTESHKQTHVPNQPRGFLDVYFDEIDKAEPGSGFYGDSGRHAMLFVLVDLFSAGAETTSTTLTNIFLYMALNEDKQRKMQAEIDRVIGSSRLPSLEDRPSMPFLEAVIHEVLRLCPLISVMHRAVQDMSFHGFNIPKDTIIMPDTYAAHYDVEFWGDPKTFRPERFISEDGKSLLKKEALIPFMPGKRVCPAETLARDELFLFTASLFQVFSVHLNPDEPKPSTELIIKTVISPKPHKLLLELRKIK